MIAKLLGGGKKLERKRGHVLVHIISCFIVVCVGVFFFFFSPEFNVVIV